MADIHQLKPQRSAEAQKAWDAAALVPDPEVPCVNVAELGILRDVQMIDAKPLPM